MSDAGDGGAPRSRLKTAAEVVIAATGVATLVVNLVLTNRALDISDRAQRQSAAQFAEERGSVKVYDTLASVSGRASPTQPRTVVVTADFELQNIGDRAVRGCTTRWEPVAPNPDLTPILYWPSVVEPGAVTWALDPGRTHVSAVDEPITQERDSVLRQYLVEFWYECANPSVVSGSVFVRVDFDHGTATQDGDLRRNPPLSSYQRYAQVERQAGRTPQPPPP